MQFQTSTAYNCREEKAAYVYDKYKDILYEKILDIGCDEKYLQKLIGDKAEYLGLGLGGNPDIEHNLDKAPIPLEDNAFNCVLCLDVLEHLENIHFVFDELCRISHKYLIISLPNPISEFIGFYQGKNPKMKFYGLPTEKPEDRHRWFFSSAEAKKFIEKAAAKNDFQIIQHDQEEPKQRVLSKLRMVAESILFDTELVRDSRKGTMWWVLEKKA